MDTQPAFNTYNAWPLKGQREVFINLAARFILSSGRLEFFRPGEFEAFGVGCYELGLLQEEADAPQLLVANIPTALFSFTSTMQLYILYEGIKYLQRRTTHETQKEILECILAHLSRRRCQTSTSVRSPTLMQGLLASQHPLLTDL